jgi:hypothetical protein
LDKQLEERTAMLNQEMLKYKELNRAIGTIFSQKQIQLMMGETSFVHWTEMDISKSIALYSASRSGYTYLRNTLKYPLPSESTLKLWLSKIDIQPGILRPVLNLVKEQFIDASPLMRAGIMAFDEVAIDERYAYDEKLDQIESN